VPKIWTAIFLLFSSNFQSIQGLEKDSQEGIIDLKIVITESSLFRSDMEDIQ
jgi:hypothetical protein